MKIQACGIFLYNNPSFIAASLDGIATCKCPGKILIEIKSPYNIKNYCRRYERVSVPGRK